MWKNIFDWLDERLGLNDMYKNLLDRPEPKGNWWNTLGSASLFLFVLQGLTGIFLTVYYTPSPDHAYDFDPIYYERRGFRVVDPRYPSLGRFVDGDHRLHPHVASVRDGFL
ncbi:MAG: hypothetical protein QM730_01590 [Anaerolineales bacterium]